MKKLTQILILVALSFACATEIDRPSLVVTGDVVNPVNDHLFGHFMEKCSWGGEIGGDLVINPGTGGFDPIVLEHLKSMKIPNIRYPGGSDVDYYDWTELIDHAPGQAVRKPYRQYRQVLEGKVVSDNRLGLDEFLDLCEAPGIRTDPGIEHRGCLPWKGWASGRPGNPPQPYLRNTVTCASKKQGNRWAACRKMNGHEDPFGVKYFEIGNEYWGFEGFRWKHDYDPEGPVRRLYQCIEAVADTLLALDPDVKIIVDGPLPELNRMLEAGMKEKIEYLVFHTYVPWGIREVFTGEDTTAADPSTLTFEQLWNAWVATPAIDPSTGLSTLPSDRYHLSALNTGFQIAVTEWNWNGWLEGAPKKAGLPESDLAKGIGAAGFLHAMMRRGERLEMACQSMTVGQSWGITGIRVDPDYLQDAVPLPSGQVTGLYSNHHGNSRLRTETRNIPFYNQPLRMNAIAPCDSVATLDILATRSHRQLFIHVINRSFVRSFDLGLELEGLEAGRDFVRHTLTGEKNAEISNDTLKQGAWTTTTPFSRSGRSLVLEVPESTVNVFVFDLE